METGTANKTIKGVHHQTVIVAAKGVLSLIYFSIMSRLLTQDDFGYFALLTAITTILLSLSEAGLGSAVIQRKTTDSAFTSTAFTLSIILGSIFAVILFAGADVFSNMVIGGDKLSLAFRIMSSMILLQAFTNITWSLYMRNLDFLKFGVLQLCSDVLSYATAVFFAINGYGFYAIVAQVVSNQIILTIILFMLGKIDYKLQIKRGYIREIINYGGWLTGAVILRNLTNEIDKIIIGRLLPISDLGALNRPQGFVGRITVQVTGIFDTVLFPILSSIQDDKDKIARGYVKIVAIVVTLSLILGTFITLGSRIVIDIFFGSQWEHLQPILAIFAMIMMVHGFSRVEDSFFRSLGILKRYFLARLINWAVLITCVVIGCNWGIMGAAVSMATGSIISCVIKYIMQYKAIGVSTSELIKTIIKNIGMPLILFMVCLIIKYIMPFGDYIGISIYSILLLFTMVFVPQVYGSIFRETVIDRYLSRVRARINRN